MRDLPRCVSARVSCCVDSGGSAAEEGGKREREARRKEGWTYVTHFTGKVTVCLDALEQAPARSGANGDARDRCWGGAAWRRTCQLD